MNRKQKAAVVVGVVVVVLLVLFPPWVCRPAPEGDPSWLLPVTRMGHHRLWATPDKPDVPYATRYSDPERDVTLQRVYMLATLALTVAAVVVLKERKG